MHFTTADLIAITFGVLVVLRWVADLLLDGNKDQRNTNDSMENKLVQVQSDLKAHEASDRIEFRWLKESMQAVDKKLDRLIERSGGWHGE